MTYHESEIEAQVNDEVWFNNLAEDKSQLCYVVSLNETFDRFVIVDVESGQLFMPHKVWVVRAK